MIQCNTGTQYSVIFPTPLLERHSQLILITQLTNKQTNKKKGNCHASLYLAFSSLRNFRRFFWDTSWQISNCILEVHKAPYSPALKPLTLEICMVCQVFITATGKSYTTTEPAIHSTTEPVFCMLLHWYLKSTCLQSKGTILLLIPFLLLIQSLLVILQEQ